MTARIKFGTRIGSAHETNEDCIIVNEQVVSSPACTGEHRAAALGMLIGIADGMGGQQSGQLASSEVLREFQALWARDATPADYLRHVQSVGEKFNALSKHYAPGAAVACMVTRKDAIDVYWAGDCTITIKFSDGSSYSTTEDVSFIFDKKILTNAIGGGIPGGGMLHHHQLQLKSCNVIIRSDGIKGDITTALEAALLSDTLTEPMDDASYVYAEILV